MLEASQITQNWMQAAAAAAAAAATPNTPRSTPTNHLATPPPMDKTSGTSSGE